MSKSEIVEGIKIHNKESCVAPCPFHVPSEHPLKDARIHIRVDKFCLVERICEHVVGHDDPDSVAYMHSIGQKWAGVHGCDGDCTIKGRVANLRRDTPCANCGTKPIEYHHPDHVNHTNSRVSSLVAQSNPTRPSPVGWSRIAKEIERCTPLCRSCHMIEDGRLEKLRVKQPYQKGKIYVVKLPCSVCKKMAKPLRKGLCWSCSEDHRPRSGRFRGHVYSDGCCSNE